MINLTTIRHDPGRIVYVFDAPERHTKPVSVLLLENDEQHLISGGWDNQVKVRHTCGRVLNSALILLLSLYFVQ
jgi:hypothetical protein